MINVTFIVVGNLKESYLREGVAEYMKRLSGFCRPVTIELKESRLSDNPSESEISASLEVEAEKILASIPPRAYKIAFCIEGKQFSSEKLAKVIDDACMEHSDICFIIGSSFGLSPRVKSAADLRMSISELTFPHQLMRLVSAEAVYRAFNIIKGTKYHK